MRVGVRATMFATAAALLAVCVYLGVRAAADATFVIWFGLATAIFAPGAFQLLAVGLSLKQEGLLRRLAAVPEINDLARKAETMQETVERLRIERAQLVELVAIEARREAVANRQEYVLDELSRLAAELRLADQEAESLEIPVLDGPVRTEIEALRQRLEARRKGDFVISFRGSDYVISRSLLRATPFGGFPLAVAELTALALSGARRSRR